MNIIKTGGGEGEVEGIILCFFFNIKYKNQITNDDITQLAAIQLVPARYCSSTRFPESCILSRLYKPYKN